MTKKIIALILVALMTFSLAACGGDKEGVSSTVSDSQVVAEVESAAQNDTKEESKQQDTTSKEETTSEEDKTPTTSTTSSTQQGTASKITGNVSTTSKPQKTQTVTADLGFSIKPAVSLKVNKGDSISQNINLKGKTITMAITEEGQYHTKSFERMISAFEAAYKCKVEIKQLNYGVQFGQQVQQAQATGNPYDICFLTNAYFPACVLDGIYQPLNDYIYEGDLATSSTSGGIDINKSAYYSHDGKVVAVANYRDVYPYILYYNKHQLSEAGYTGSKDPRKMAENGKWTWDVIKAMGRRLSNAKEGKFFASTHLVAFRAIPLSYGATIARYDSKTGKYVQNITSEDWNMALKLIQEFSVGANAIVDTAGKYTSGGQASFEQGEVMLWAEESSKYIDLIPTVVKSSHFGRDKKNLAIVEIPLAGNNKDRHPTGYITGIAAGMSSKSKKVDPRVAIAFAVFRSKYKDPNASSDATSFSAEDQKYLDKLLSGNIICDYGRFFSSDGDTEDLIYYANLLYKVRTGAVIAQEVSNYKDSVQGCIDYSMGYK